MPRPLTPYKTGDTARVLEALRLLRHSRDLLAAAGAPRAVVKTNRAIKSTEGALRHVDHRQWDKARGPARGDR